MDRQRLVIISPDCSSGDEEEDESQNLFSVGEIAYALMKDDPRTLAHLRTPSPTTDCEFVAPPGNNNKEVANDLIRDSSQSLAHLQDPGPLSGILENNVVEGGAIKDDTRTVAPLQNPSPATEFEFVVDNEIIPAEEVHDVWELETLDLVLHDGGRLGEKRNKQHDDDSHATINNNCDPKTTPNATVVLGEPPRETSGDAIDTFDPPILRERSQNSGKTKLALKQKSKINRARGEPYVGFRRMEKGNTKKIIQDVDREGRTLGEPCVSLTCRKWATRSCPTISNDKRQEIFRNFWKNMTWGEKQTYVCSTVKIENKKQNTVQGKPSRRTLSFFYHLKIGEQIFPVCREMYLSTLGLKRGELHYWLSNFHHSNIPSGRGALQQQPSQISLSQTDSGDVLVAENNLSPRPAQQPVEKIGTIEFKQAMEYLSKFLNALPTLPSHYCRKTSSKLYLQTDIRSWNQLYQLYAAKCMEDGVKLVSKYSFRRMRKSKSIDIHQPKKDRCDVCCSFEQGHTSQELHAAHQLKKEAARSEKEKDKKQAIEGLCHALCFDLMMVQPLPRLSAAAAYYKLKLTAHCYTIYNLKTHDCIAYWFDETQTSLSANTFASCLWDHLQELLDHSNMTIILWSDGCTYQNRNSTLANALLHLSVLKNVTIIQKFLEKGHTQMECDSAHSTIERRIEKVDVHLTSEYVTLTKDARKNPVPYRAKMLDYNFIKNFSVPNSMIYSSIRPGRKSGDPTVTEIRWLQYEPTGKIKYKLNFQDDLKELPMRPKSVKPVSSFPQLYFSRPSVPLDKWSDLQTLKTLMPSDTHPWYDAIPHEDESRRKLKRKTESSSKD